VGIAFHTRAEGEFSSEASRKDAFLDRVKRRQPGTKRLPSSLSTIFPDYEISQAEKMKNRLACCFKSSSAVRRMNRWLKVSSIITAAYVLGNVAVEPTCTAELASPSSLIKRLTSDGHELGGVLAMFHLTSAIFYSLVMVPVRVGASRLGTRGGDELLTAVHAKGVRFCGKGLWLDMVSFVGLIAEVVHWVENPPDGTPTAAQWLMLLQLVKIWRIVSPEGTTTLETYSFLQGLLKLFFLLGCFAHGFACLLLIIGNQELSWGSKSWIMSLRQLHGDEDDCFVVYTEAFYFASLSITSVGYGDLLLTPLERGINALVLLLSQLFLAKVCADLTWLTSTHNHWEAQTESQRAQIWVALQHMQVPRVLAKRVLAYQNYMANVHRDDLSQPCFAGLSENLLKELRLCSYQNLVMRAPFLREQPKEVIALIVGALYDSIYLPADFIVCPGQRGRELYFMRRGEAAVYVTPEPPTWVGSKPVATYVTGNYFGELAMLTGRPRAAWIMARLYCVCSVLPYSAVEQLIGDHPGAFTTLVQSMVQTFNLKPRLSWGDVIKMLAKKHQFASLDDAFRFFRMHASDVGTDFDEDELSAKAFDETLRRLKVPVLDRKIFWAEMDIDNSGCVTMPEFAHVLQAHGWDELMPAPQQPIEMSSSGQLPLLYCPTGDLAMLSAASMPMRMMREGSMRAPSYWTGIRSTDNILEEEGEADSGNRKPTRSSLISVNSAPGEPASPMGSPTFLAANNQSPSSVATTAIDVNNKLQVPPPLPAPPTLTASSAAEQ